MANILLFIQIFTQNLIYLLQLDVAHLLLESTISNIKQKPS